jgi:hypothetical protein
MKKMRNIFIIAVIAAITFGSCEREIVKDVVNNSETNAKTFTNVNWVLIDENHVNEYGYGGFLYENSNNPNERKFVVKYVVDGVVAKACPGAKGTYSETRNEDGKVISVSCGGDSDNCYAVEKDGKVEIVKLECEQLRQTQTQMQTMRIK